MKLYAMVWDPNAMLCNGVCCKLYNNHINVYHLTIFLLVKTNMGSMFVKIRQGKSTEDTILVST